MRTHFVPVTDNDRLQACFGTCLPEGLALAHEAGEAGEEVMAPVIVPAEAAPPGAPGRACLGVVGLLPHFAKDIGLARHGRHCRVETMKSTPTFRESWWAGRRCIVPAQSVSAWCYESGRPELWAIQRPGDEALALAGLWNEWVSPAGETLLSFSLLTLNAQGHEVFGRMDAPDHDKRMPVILPAASQALWLGGALKDAERLLVRCPAAQLQAAPQAPAAKPRREPRSWAAVPDMFAYEWHVSACELPAPRRTRAPRALPAPLPELPAPTTGSLF